MARLTPVSDPAHPLLADFVALSDPATRRRVEREGDYFVVEGVVAIERLLAQPEWTIRSMALLPKVATRLADQLDGHPAADLAVAVADRNVLGEVVGFDIHRGALASVDRRPPPPIAELVGASGLYLVAEGINDHENLGSLYRNAAAFGAAGVLLDPSSADPFYRRSVRVSSGHVLTVPTATLAPFPEGLEHLRRLGVTTVGLTPGGQDLGDLGPDALGHGPVAIVVGAEGPGLSAAALTAVDHRVAIPMAAGVDSINVATAAAIALHHLRTGGPASTEAEPGDPPSHPTRR